MSTSMNNRLLQNYLDLSVHSDAKNSIMTTPKSDSDPNLAKTNAKEKAKPVPTFYPKNFNAATIIKCASDNYLASSEKKISNEKNFESIEFKNLEHLKAKLGFQSDENNNKNSSANTFNTLHGSVNVSDSDLNKMNILLRTFNENLSNRILSNTRESGHSKDTSDYEFTNKVVLYNDPNKYEMVSRLNNVDDESLVEISRIPSLRRTKYSVSTIATQADMEKGSILAERKDFKYRNQEMSDVESQILSIEVDLGSEVGCGPAHAYGSVNSDWYNNNTG